MAGILSAFVGVAAANISGQVSVANGGTGASTAPAALGALGVPNNPGPGVQGMLAWNWDVAAGGSTGTIAIGGTLYLLAITLEAPVTITNILMWNTAAAVTPTAGESQVGLYNSAGTLVASATTSATATAMVAGPNALATYPLSATYAAAAGTYWVGAVWQAGTLPTALRNNAGASSTVMNLNLAAAAFRVAVNGTGITTALPASITPASNSQTNEISYWVGLS